MLGLAYNSINKLKMENEISSIKFQRIEDVELFKIGSSISKYNTIICDNQFNYLNCNAKIILIISSIDQKIIKSDNIIMVQYESNEIKDKITTLNNWLIDLDSVVINCIPEQKLKINPLNTQNATIFFCGKDKPENMVDEMFELDTNVHYEIKFYNNDKEEPSKRHKLSWNVTIDKNLKGIISYKIIKEIENGCLPILLKENSPSNFFAYPFFITLEQLNDKNKLIKRVREISSFISKMSKDDFSFLANSIYNSIYVYSYWKLNFFKICKKIDNI